MSATPSLPPIQMLPAVLLWGRPRSTYEFFPSPGARAYPSGAPHWAAASSPLESPAERFLACAPHAPAKPAPPMPVWTEPPLDPAAVAAARRMLTLILEVWNGRRPAAHLDPFLDPNPARYVRIVAERLGNHRPARLSSLRVYQPHPRAAEVSAVCRVGRRPRAVAARLEHLASSDTGWRCRVLQLG